MKLSKEHERHADRFHMKRVRDRMGGLNVNQVNVLLSNLKVRETWGETEYKDWLMSDIPLIKSVLDEMAYKNK